MSEGRKIILPPGVEDSREEEKKEEKGEEKKEEAKREPTPEIHPTEEDLETAYRTSETLARELTTPGSQLAFLRNPQTRRIILPWLHREMQEIVNQAVVQDRGNILQRLQAELKQHLDRQRILEENTDPTLKKALLASNGPMLHEPTVRALLTGYANIAGATPPPTLQIRNEETPKESGKKG